MRPFTVTQLNELLQRTGTIADFWIDKIKSTALVEYSNKGNIHYNARKGSTFQFLRPSSKYVFWIRNVFAIFLLLCNFSQQRLYRFCSVVLLHHYPSAIETKISPQRNSQGIFIFGLPPAPTRSFKANNSMKKQQLHIINGGTWSIRKALLKNIVCQN